MTKLPLNAFNKPRKPEWIISKLGNNQSYAEVRRVLNKYRLHTICEDALCPNKGECWTEAHATLLILGNICTRNCLFCKVDQGKQPKPPLEDEPERIAFAVKELQLKYVVLTSPSRDDLPDGGASIFAETSRQIKKINPHTRIELLIPDFNNRLELLLLITRENPEVIAHNLEVVSRLTPIFRDQKCSFNNSLNLLKTLKKIPGNHLVKTGIMLGLGENWHEITNTIKEIRNFGVDIITIGQYLQPSKKHPQVVRYYTPEEFEKIKMFSQNLGFFRVISGPLVRSSYLAGKY